MRHLAATATFDPLAAAASVRSRFPCRWLDRRTALETLQPSDLIALRRHDLLQFRYLAQQFHKPSFQLGTRQVGRIGGQRHTKTESYLNRVGASEKITATPGLCPNYQYHRSTSRKDDIQLLSPRTGPRIRNHPRGGVFRCGAAERASRNQNHRDADPAGRGCRSCRMPKASRSADHPGRDWRGSDQGTPDAPVKFTFFIWAGSNQGVVSREVFKAYREARPEVTIEELESTKAITYPKWWPARRTTPENPMAKLRISQRRSHHPSRHRRNVGVDEAPSTRIPRRLCPGLHRR